MKEVSNDKDYDEQKTNKAKKHHLPMHLYL